MKRFFIFLLLLPVATICVAQHTVVSQKYKFSFETSEQLDNYETESEDVVGHDNNNYAVDVQVIPFSEENQKFLSDVKYAAGELAEGLGFESYVQGGSLPNIKSGYYVKSTDTDGTPVFIIVILNNDTKQALEATVYCYNNNTSEGEGITKSFKLLR